MTNNFQNPWLKESFDGDAILKSYNLLGQDDTLENSSTSSAIKQQGAAEEPLDIIVICTNDDSKIETLQSDGIAFISADAKMPDLKLRVTQKAFKIPTIKGMYAVLYATIAVEYKTEEKQGGEIKRRNEHLRIPIDVKWRMKLDFEKIPMPSRKKAPYQLPSSDTPYKVNLPPYDYSAETPINFYGLSRGGKCTVSVFETVDAKNLCRNSYFIFADLAPLNSGFMNILKKRDTPTDIGSLNACWFMSPEVRKWIPCNNSMSPQAV